MSISESDCTIHCRRIESNDVVEIHMSVTPSSPICSPSEAVEFFQNIQEFLTSQNASIFSERLFVSQNLNPNVFDIREAAYGVLHDGVQPSVLVDYNKSNDAIINGVQIHALQTEAPVQVIRANGSPLGRRLQIGNKQWISLSGITGTSDQTRPQQARQMFETATSLLNQHGATPHDIARTWLWLDNICDWYDDFNKTRSEFFVSQGLIDRDRGICKLPASTGIGVANPSLKACSLDLLAAQGGDAPFHLVEAGGNQNSAFNYGSAFSRAAVVDMPAGKTVYISGTAAIDPAGATEHIDHIEQQIESTIAHVRSILNELACDDSGVLHAIVYCRNPRVLEVFRRDWAADLWPHVSMIADICRDDLLFEIEAIAIPR